MGCVIDRDGSTGFDWCRKKDEKLRRSSRTLGGQKGAHCIASPKDRYMAKRGRSYKHREYAEWCKSHKGHK